MAQIAQVTSTSVSSEPIIECVPNFSEGRDVSRIVQIMKAMRIDGVQLLDYSLDRDHNRSVITIAGAPGPVVEAAVRGAGRAAELLDLATQSGVHPRIGATDVIPFVPVSSVSLAECAMLARQAGIQIWRRFGVPVYYYGAAAARPDRVDLENVRRGQFEGLRQSVLTDASRRPDVGGPELHPTAGASAVGARNFLVAYNIYLNPGSIGSTQMNDIGAARAIARQIRASSGGLQGVKALGLMANGRPQVSMNITDFRIAPMRRVYEEVSKLAERHGLAVADGELIGLIPEEAYEPGAEWASRVVSFDPDTKILERRLRHPERWPDLSKVLEP